MLSMGRGACVSAEANADEEIKSFIPVKFLQRVQKDVADGKANIPRKIKVSGFKGGYADLSGEYILDGTNGSGYPRFRHCNFDVFLERVLTTWSSEQRGEWFDEHWVFTQEPDKRPADLPTDQWRVCMIEHTDELLDLRLGKLRAHPRDPSWSMRAKLNIEAVEDRGCPECAGKDTSE